MVFIYNSRQYEELDTYNQRELENELIIPKLYSTALEYGKDELIASGEFSLYKFSRCNILGHYGEF